METKVKIEHKHGPTCLRGEKQPASVTTEAHNDVHSSFRMAQTLRQGHDRPDSQTFSSAMYQLVGLDKSLKLLRCTFPVVYKLLCCCKDWEIKVLTTQ